MRTKPSRRFEDVELTGDNIALKGWFFRAEGTRRGTVIYLHGVADNRASGNGIVDHLVPKGFDVLAYDSRANGDSGGTACTYGYYERRDLIRVIDRVLSPVVLLGVSLGAAVALQTAAEDDRIVTVVAIATFSDLRTVATERLPFFVTGRSIEDAFRMAEKAAGFRVDDVSPAAAATRIRVPVLLVHGARDREISVEHSQRVYDALVGPKRLLVVPEAGHDDTLRPSVWKEIDDWISAAVPAPETTG